jgi:S-adenosylmethionine:tRNA ribosyltransferase-isomerase
MSPPPSLSTLRLSDFDYSLPEELIAQEPLAERDASRLLVVPRDGSALAHGHVRALPSLLRPDDLLVFNDARVIPARLFGRKAQTGGQVELLLVEPLTGRDHETWYCLGQASKGLKRGQQLEFGPKLNGTVVEVASDGALHVQLSLGGDALLAALWEQGEIPLPPYIRHAHVAPPNDPNAARYQTIFARRPGASAAPTAGLHFTERLLASLDAAGIQRTTVTLFVGPGTFLPVRTEDISQHRMHSERYEIPPEAVVAVAQARQRGGRVIPVGTTSLRALEAAAQSGTLQAGPGATDLFLVPGATFRVADGLLTNFHLPKSTLLMLVAAMAGRDRILEAYRQAVAERYRFFSYGDAMLIV